ncbi:MAG: aminopeptidase P family protein [Clostridia bacterium]|nr:aminopeptidase P family protein [Clostridia bacterium]
MNKKVTVIEDVDLIYYFIKRTVDDAFLVLTNNEYHLFVDLRYYEAVKNDKGVCVHLLNSSEVLYEFIATLNVKEIGLVYDYSSAKLYDALIKLGYVLYDDGAQILQKTSIKNQSELSIIKEACKIAETAFESVLPSLKEGVTESEIQSELEYLFRKFGAEDKAFNSIVAFGEGSSIPHYKTGNTVLKKNMPVLFDFGCKYKGYLSDMSRSFYFGTPPKKYVDAFNAVCNAQRLAISNIKAGITCKEADAIARNYLKSFDLDKYFIHSLGHGVGVKIHEEPRLSIKSEQILVENNVFSVEPGVYFEGEFGIRIEDTCFIKDGVCRSFMSNKIELTLN